MLVAKRASEARRTCERYPALSGVVDTVYVCRHTGTWTRPRCPAWFCFGDGREKASGPGVHPMVAASDFGRGCLTWLTWRPAASHGGAETRGAHGQPARTPPDASPPEIRPGAGRTERWRSSDRQPGPLPGVAQAAVGRRPPGSSGTRRHRAGSVRGRPDLPRAAWSRSTS
jgi:hypothetical protein